MKTTFNVSVSFDVLIDLEDLEIEASDILDAFGAEHRELTDAEVGVYVRDYLAAEDIYSGGNIQDARITSVQPN